MKPSIRTLTALSLCVAGLLMVSGHSFAEEKEVLAPAENWRLHCQRCHGADGTGKTRLGQRMGLRDYTDPQVQAAMSDEEIIGVIRKGVKDESGREVKPGLADKLSAEEIEALVEYIRAMEKKD